MTFMSPGQGYILPTGQRGQAQVPAWLQQYLAAMGQGVQAPAFSAQGPMGDIPISALQQMAGSFGGGPAGLGSAATHYTGLQQWVPKLWERYPTQYQFTPQAVPWRQMGYMGAQTPVSTPQQTVARMALGLMPWMTPIEQRQWAMWIQANAPELTRGEQGPALSVKKFEEWNPLTAAQAMTPEERYAYESADRVRQIAYALGLAGGQGWTQPTGPGGGMGTLIPNPQNPWGQVYDPLQTALKTALAYSPGGTITGERPRRTAAEQRLFEKEWETLMNWAPSQLPQQTQGMIQGQTGADPAQTWALMQPFLTQLLGPWGRTWEKEPGWTRAAHAPIRTSPWLLTPSTTRQQRR